MKTHTRLDGSGTPPGRAPRWAPLLLLWLTAGAYAAPQDIELGAPCPANLDYTIDATVGQALNLNLGVLNGNGSVFWDFVTAPAGCAAPPYACNGVTIALPAGAPDNAVADTAVATVSGSPTAAGTFSFRMVVARQDSTASCERTYDLVITQPYDIVFVLDRSGSMTGTGNITAPATTRWSALTNAVNDFTPFLDLGSRFGLTLFGTDVINNNTFANGPFPGGLPTIGASLAADVNTELTSQSPSGWTAMGKGLKNGISKLSGDTTRPRVIVLFTDGEQNQAPEVNLNGRGFSDGTSINPSYPAGAGSIKVCTVGIGDPSGAYHDTLQNLATENRCTYITTTTGLDFNYSDGTSLGDITAAFNFAIAPTLSGNSPQMVDYQAGTLAGTVTLPAFDVNRKVKGLVLKLSFNRNFEIPELSAILAGLHIRKDGAEVTPYFQPVVVGNYTNTLLLKTDFTAKGAPPLAPDGSYTVQMTKPANISQDLTYRAVTYADDPRLAMDWKVVPAAPRVNQTFTPTMTLGSLGSPVIGATVEAWVLKPGDDLGDLLARNPQTVDPSSAPDAGSPGHQKYDSLVKNDPAFLNQLRPSENKLTLAHQGNGVYNTSYSPGDVSGVYQVLYRVSLDDPTIGKVQRIALQSVYTRFGAIDLAASGPSATIRGNTLTLKFRPITTYGRFIGPAQGAALSVSGPGVTVNAITDHQDGSYTLDLTGTATAPISITVLGEEIYKGPAADFGAGAGPGTQNWFCQWWEGLGIPCWLGVLITVAVVVLVLWWLLRSKP